MTYQGAVLEQQHFVMEAMGAAAAAAAGARAAAATVYETEMAVQETATAGTAERPSAED